MHKQSRMRRSIKVMKVFMLLIIAIPFLQYQQTGSFSLQDIFATLACLCWMQALLLSPKTLVTPLKQWSSHAHHLSPASKHFMLTGFVLMLCVMLV